jgi:hypothetical protein
MPGKATGRKRGRPRYSWDWWGEPLREDRDWLVLSKLLKRCSPEGFETVRRGPRPFIREALSTDPLLVDYRNDCVTVNNCEKKFRSLIATSIDRLRHKHLDTSAEAVITEARNIILNCAVWCVTTPDEREIIDRAEKVQQKISINARGKFVILITPEDREVFYRAEKIQEKINARRGFLLRVY